MNNHKESVNLKKFFMEICQDISFTLPPCHNLKTKIISRYYTLRMRLSSKKMPVTKNITYSSKSMAMHHCVCDLNILRHDKYLFLIVFIKFIIIFACKFI